MSSINGFRRPSRSALFGVVGAAVLSFGAFAANAAEPKQVVVRYTELELTQSADAQKLYERLQRASATVCSDRDVRDLRRMRANSKCAAEALGDAVAAVDSALLTSLHRADGQVTVAQQRTAQRT